MRIIVLLLVVLSVFNISCSKHPRYKAEPAIKLVFDTTVDGEYQELMELDQKTLTWAQPSGTEGADVFGFSEFTSASMSAWLRERAKYIVGEDYNIKANLISERGTFNYSPDLAALINDVEEAPQAYTMMANEGVYAYKLGKINSTVNKVRIGGETPTILSARIGIFSIGEGLFAQKTVGAVGKTDTLASSIRRLAILFHEARHCDGNEADKSLGFLHEICPASVDGYAGEPACDNFLNGAYTVGKITLQRLYNSCDDCNSEEKEGLTTLIADYATRVLPTARTRDARAEKIKL